VPPSLALSKGASRKTSNLNMTLSQGLSLSLPDSV
jgi:hypothetical protein